MGAKEGNKKPRAVAGAGFFGSLQVCCLVTWTQPSARTSAGNEEYEYKGKKKEAAAKQQRVADRRGATGHGDAAVAVALRHESTIGQSRRRRQQFHMHLYERIRSDVQMSVWELPSIRVRMVISPGR